MFTLEAIQLAGGSLVTAGLLAAAGANRRQPVRSLALIAIALFVWLRPGIKPSGRPSLLYLAAGAALVALLIRAARSTQVRARLASAPGSRDPRHLMLAVAALLLLMAPAALIPIVSNWDASGWMDSQTYDTFAINIVTGKAIAGNSGYMPFYQYGMAAVYYLAGHFFFAQQLVNAAFAVAGLVALCAAAWTLFDRSLPAAAIAGTLYVYTRQFFFAVHYTQVEAWYVPLVCLVLLAWARYWRAPGSGRAAWLAAAIGIGLSTRNQGAFFFALACLAPLAVAQLPWCRRAAHLAVIAALVTVILLPWTLRNIAVEGRWSPFAERSAMYIGFLTDPRLGLYGVRYWEGWDDVARDYQSRFPDTNERERAYLEGARRNLTSNPGWLARAVAWRTTAFYGLLPDGLLALDRIRPTEWRSEWARYVFSRTTPLVLLPLSLLAAAVRPSRTTAFLLAAITASLVIVIVSASPEDRISYPVLPLHILLASSLFAGVAPQRVTAAAGSRPWSRVRPRTLAAVAAGAIVLGIGVRLAAGARFTYRPIKAAHTITAETVVDRSLPLVNDAYNDGRVLAVGSTARARVMLSNYMYPPKFVGDVSFVPPFATAKGSPQYYFAYLVTDGEAPLLGPAMGIMFAPAQANEQIREGDAAEVEGVLQHSSPQNVTGYWMQVTKVRRLPIPRERMPVFP